MKKLCFVLIRLCGLAVHSAMLALPHPCAVANLLIARRRPRRLTQVVWLWEVLQSLDQASLSHVLFFWHAASATPVGGFRTLKNGDGEPCPLTVSRATVCGDGAFPVASTCFNTINLPEYTSKEVLREKLLGAVVESRSGPGFTRA